MLQDDAHPGTHRWQRQLQEGAVRGDAGRLGARLLDPHHGRGQPARASAGPDVMPRCDRTRRREPARWDDCGDYEEKSYTWRNL